jgi:hypothetical protein
LNSSLILNYMEMKTKLFITALALMSITALTSAQNTDPEPDQQKPAGWGPAFVDTNNNGICDNYENYVNVPGRRFNAPAQGRGLGPGQGRGLRPGMGRGLGPGQGARFGNAPGQGFRTGYGPVQGRGRFWVDENKNGICDYYETPPPK